MKSAFWRLIAALFVFACIAQGPTLAQVTSQQLGIYARALRGQLPGTATNDAASAGNIGQTLTANRASGSALSLTTATAASLASISITAGDWMVTGNICFSSAATTTVNVLIGYINVTQNGLGTLSEYNQARLKFNALVFNGGDTCLAVPAQRVSLSSTTTYYANAYADFGTSTMTAYGQLTAWRVR